MSPGLDKRVVWITGLSGAGKSSLAHEVVLRLRAEGKAVVMLDGDELREVFGSASANVANHGRDAHDARDTAPLCGMLVTQGLPL